MLAKACDNENTSKLLRDLWQEVKELSMIFHSIVATMNSKKDDGDK